MRRPLARVFLALAAGTWAWGVASAEPLRVRVELAPGADPRLPVSLTLSPSGSPDGELARQLEAPGEAVFDLPLGSSWEISLRSPGYWSKPQSIVVGPRGERITLRLWPAGKVRGEVQLASAEKPPKEISLRFQPPPGASAARSIPQGSVVCPIAERRFVCEVPAGVLDLRFRVPGFVSRYLWSAEIARGGELRVGSIALQPGASVVGWIAAPERNFRFDDCRVELAPRVGGLAPSMADLERGAAQVLGTRVSRRGFFQLSGVPAGSYRLTVRHPRFAPAHVAPLPVADGAETEIRQIDLHPPVELTVSVSPAVDPFLGRWSLRLERNGEIANYFAPAAAGTATLEGTWKAAGLEPGKYQLTLLDTRGSRWASRAFDLGEEPLALEVEARFTRVQGTVTLGGEPLAATLWFGGRNAPRRIQVESGEEGKFYAFLPWDGTWDVDVQAQVPRVSTSLAGLVVKTRRGAPGVLDIDLPDTRLSIEVVGDDGRPAPGAWVRAVGEGPREAIFEQSRGDEGRLELRGLTPGRWLLSAEDQAGDRKHRTAPTAAVEVEKAKEVTARLILRASRKLSGLVLSPTGGGVPGAQVVAALETGQLPSLEAPSTVTDVDGRFELDIPSEAGAPRLSVLPPGFALQQLPPHSPEEGPLVVAADQNGGTLILKTSGRFDFTQPTALPVLYGQHALWLHLAYSWAQLNGVDWKDSDRIVIPMLSPGPYTACWTGAGTASIEVPAQRPDLCAAGVLVPNGELVLQLPQHGSTRANR